MADPGTEPGPAAECAIIKQTIDSVTIVHNFRHNIFIKFIQAKTISRARLDGSEQSVVIHSNGMPDSIAVDPLARNIYWTDPVTDTISVAKLDGSSRKVRRRKDPYKNYLFKITRNFRHNPSIHSYIQIHGCCCTHIAAPVLQLGYKSSVVQNLKYPFSFHISPSIQSKF